MRKEIKIAIHKNEKVYKHSNSWSHEWIDYCKKNELDYEVVDCYSLNALDKLKDFDVLLWHFSNYSLQDMLFARSILLAAKNTGMDVFPDYKTSWHFDDKVAESYLLQSAGAPIPNFWVFYTLNDCAEWLKTKAEFPLVGKLRSGSGSNNVKLLKNESQALGYVKRMFGKGFRNVPGVLFKTASNVKSSHDWETFRKRFKKIPDFIKTYRRSLKLPAESGYAYFQEFIPNNGFDVRIVVVGDKLSFVLRNVRSGDFRASGGGSVFFDKKIVTEEIIRTAFQISDSLGFQCMAYDFVINNKTNKAVVVEISYGFPYTNTLKAGGYWDRQLVWYDEPLNAPEEVLENIIKRNKKLSDQQIKNYSPENTI